MSLYQCEECGCVENTACGHYHLSSWKDCWAEEFEGRELCSACGPKEDLEGKPTKFGEWHGEFDRDHYPLNSLYTDDDGNVRNKSNDEYPADSDRVSVLTIESMNKLRDEYFAKYPALKSYSDNFSDTMLMASTFKQLPVEREPMSIRDYCIASAALMVPEIPHVLIDIPMERFTRSDWQGFPRKLKKKFKKQMLKLNALADEMEKAK